MSPAAKSPTRRQIAKPKVRNATAAGAGIGTLITILSHAVDQRSTWGQILLWANPTLTSFSAWVAYHLPKWLLFQWDLMLLNRIAKNNKLTDEAHKEATALAAEMRAERSARVFRRVRSEHLETGEG